MSTKTTIDHGPDNYFVRQTPEGVDYHIFYQMCDQDNIYLELVNCSYFETEYSEYHKGIKTTIAIPGKLWNHIVRLGELKPWGGEEEDFDNPRSPEERAQAIKDNLEEFMASLEAMKKRREARKDAEAEGESL